MDFDSSKENIQPLRGGRNVHQLEVALQAQTDHESQMQLARQKEEFDRAIKNYQGDDPLENYYQYIYWIEQSYPKNGHEGNCAALLEHCLGQFENDPRYTNDRRLCKLWIKYIDLTPNPIELYLMMKAKGLCIGCADFYKAWAYYYEMAGDFQKANGVFEEGKKNLAQPYEELELAHKNLITAAGEHMLYGPNQTRLLERRHALTALPLYASGRVSSVRQSSAALPNGAFVVPGTSSENPLRIYEDRHRPTLPQDAAAGPQSIIKVAKRQEAPKENTIKAGPWTTIANNKKRAVGSHRPGGRPTFTILEDNFVAPGFPPNVPPACLEDYSNWRVSIINFPEEPSPTVVHGYPKSRVYIDSNTEYSIEELRATGYKRSPSTETDRAVQSILIDDEDDCLLVEDDAQPAQINSTVKHSPWKTFTQHQNFLQDVFSKSNEQRLSMVAAPRFQLFSPEKDSPKQKFCIFEEELTKDGSLQPKGNAMKTAFRTLNADELVETGSCSGMDVAMAAQPADGAKPMPNLPFSDSSSSSFGDAVDPVAPADISCNTEQFCINLNVMQVSTPNPKWPGPPQLADQHSTRKMLFSEAKAPEKGLSTIIEESKSGSSGSSSSSCATPYRVSQNRSRKMSTISEEHNSYLAQNLMANAALRQSLLGDLMATLDVPASPTPVQASPSASRRPQGAVVAAPSDPFCPELLDRLLERVGFPGPHDQGYVHIEGNPRLVAKKEPVSVGGDVYYVDKVLGKGQFGTVFKAQDRKTGSQVALKYQKPPNRWEYYVCRELRRRLAAHPLRDRFMDVTLGYFSDQASVLVSEFGLYGSLLDAVNLLKTKGAKPKEALCVYLTLEMLRIVRAMHDAGVIHADIKPDNFLVLLNGDNAIGLRLIDFGCSIDMTLFPEGTTFTRPITTENFVCCEVRDGRPWSYHTDLFCVAATAHVLLFQEYIQLRKVDQVWSISTRLPRYAKLDLWNMFFSSMLNQQTGPADAATLQLLFEEEVELHRKRDLPAQIRYLVNLLKNR
ncbi:mitotic checkpoint serine/threonine-protein kinase BUB1-like [Cylas formicarius]|uniref:mitotic checkpoint serine/threonine-protein kinase BUB1-like n=1 Tax=Cylas formicarius TaxID=197179 RepID=UPI0029589A45|nr:mitotic checkpoint serine/threonine-protein kinase BUB1-like [Cylas formicarius]XP_060527403.1 mitotic checkpoint serine/threonine-protein kinase BUB1-like [Cylas formicarius]